MTWRSVYVCVCVCVSLGLCHVVSRHVVSHHSVSFRSLYKLACFQARLLDIRKQKQRVDCGKSVRSATRRQGQDQPNERYLVLPEE